jgi:hypothetical protein
LCATILHPLRHGSLRGLSPEGSSSGAMRAQVDEQLFHSACHD